MNGLCASVLQTNRKHTEQFHCILLEFQNRINTVAIKLIKSSLLKIYLAQVIPTEGCRALTLPSNSELMSQ